VRQGRTVATWTAQTEMAGYPEQVMELLTTLDAISHWAPVAFEVVDYDRDRLAAGDRVRVRGGFAGRSVEFDVDVIEADDGHLALTARGPIHLDVEYLATALEHGSALSASITVTGRGLIGRLLAQATDALLASGALQASVRRIAGALQPV
jgi:hypothetical protein